MQLVAEANSQYGSLSAAEFSDRHGRTCFNTGRQGTQPLCILLIDGMTVAIKGKRHARSTSVTGRHGRRPWHLQRAKNGCEQLRQYQAYSITSSASTKIVRGTVRPSALAVLRLTTISYFTGNCTGRSLGFAPRRMRST
jgi:hypothetical protein